MHPAPAAARKLTWLKLDTVAGRWSADWWLGAAACAEGTGRCQPAEGTDVGTGADNSESWLERSDWIDGAVALKLGGMGAGPAMLRLERIAATFVEGVVEEEVEPPAPEAKAAGGFQITALMSWNGRGRVVTATRRGVGVSSCVAASDSGTGTAVSLEVTRMAACR